MAVARQQSVALFVWTDNSFRFFSEIRKMQLACKVPLRQRLISALSFEFCLNGWMKTTVHGLSAFEWPKPLVSA